MELQQGDITKSGPKLSVGIIAKNEAHKIGRTLAAVKDWASEIIVVDSGSTDGTQEICRQHGARVIEQNWLGYGPQKNVVIEHCRHEWILAIDADEVATPELCDEIAQVLSAPKFDAYAIRFKHILFGTAMRYSGISGQYRLRLFKRSAGKWDNKIVHEGFDTNTTIGQIHAQILHYSYSDVNEFLEKQERYTTLEAENRFANGDRPNFLLAAFRGVRTFLSLYFRRLGFLDGRAGFVFAKYSALYLVQTERKLASIHAGTNSLTQGD